MKILGIETSCDETAASIIKGEKNDSKVKVLKSSIATSLSLHSKTGGIIPEIAARQQIKYILPVIENVLESEKNIDAIAVTMGPGLVGSLIVGIETAKTFSLLLKKPIIPVNHLMGHIYANFISDPSNNPNKEIQFPAIVLIASGGHTELLLMEKHGKIKWIGGTRDDAAGEAFDKIARLLGLSYPGGPVIEETAKKGNPDVFRLPRPMIGSGDFDFSFSGLKTAVLKEINIIKTKLQSKSENLSKEVIANLCASVEQSVIDVLVNKTFKAAQKYKVKSILLSGGVTSNKNLREQFKLEMENLKSEIGLFVPPPYLCTDNASMIASAAFFNFNPIPFEKITVKPDLYFK